MLTAGMETPGELTFHPENQKEQQSVAIAALMLSFIGLLGHPVAQVLGLRFFLGGILVALQWLGRYPRLILRGNRLEVLALPIHPPWRPAAIDLSTVGPGYVVQRQTGRWPGRVTLTYLMFRPLEDQHALDATGETRPPDFFDRQQTIVLNGFIGNDLAAAKDIADVVNAWRPAGLVAMDPGEARNRVARLNRRRQILLWLVVLAAGAIWLWLLLLRQ
jgi:hypothetical protein